MFSQLIICLFACFKILQAQSSIDCISSFVELESVVLSSDGNIQSLIQAFYPANQYPALWVEVRYYINESTIIEHPVFGGSIQYEANYTFYWSVSPVLTFIPPELLEGMSLQFVQIETHVTDLVIIPFCSQLSETDILGLFNNVTLWLKSYAVMRGVSEGVDTSSQGYVLYKLGNSQIRLFQDSTSNYSSYEIRMIASVVLIVLVVQLWAPFKVYQSYDSMQKESKKGITHSEQKFRFKSLFWAFIATLGIAVAAIVLMDLYHIATFVVYWNDNRRFLYYITAAVFFLFFAFDGLIAIILIKMFHKKQKLVNIPNLLLCQRDPSSYDNLSFIWKAYYLLFQFIAVTSLLSFSSLSTLHGCGIVLALLAHPVQVFSMAVLIFTMALSFMLLLTFVFEDFELSCKTDASIAVTVCKLIVRVLLSVSVVAFLYLFGTTYLNVVLFVGNDSTGVVDSLAQIFPALLLSFLGWVIKKEYDNFVKHEKDSVSIKEIPDSVVIIGNEQLNINDDTSENIETSI